MWSVEGGMLSVDCGVSVSMSLSPSPYTPHSSLHIPHSNTLLTQIHSPLKYTPLHAARHTERSSDGSKDTDGNLQDSFPSVLVHDFLDLIVSTYLSLEFRVKNVELSA